MKNIIITITYFISLTSCLNPRATLDQDKIIESLANSISIKFKEVPIITAKQLAEEIQNKSADIILVDTRNIREQKVSMIEGSINHDEFMKSVDSYRSKMIYTYSTIGGESSDFSRKLLAKGLKSMSLFGGTLSWAQGGYSFIKDAQATKKLGIENEAWNILPREYEGVFP